MKLTFTPEEADTLFDQLPNYETKRLQEITRMFQPYIDVTDKYARLVSRLTNLLGHIAPSDTQDVVVRDLMADVFDFLYESRGLIVGGKLILAYPLARRAYESLSLLSLCGLDVKWANKWQDGKKIENRDVRKHLSLHPIGEPEANMQSLYNFFSSVSHPNREMIGERHLGAGNEYVLGMIGAPDVLAIVDYCIKHLELWHWLMLVVTYFYREKLFAHDPTYLKLYDETIKEGNQLKKWLIDSTSMLIKERMEIEANNSLRSSKIGK